MKARCRSSWRNSNIFPRVWSDRMPTWDSRSSRSARAAQLELDRRKLDKRVHLLKERLVKLKSQRDVMRRSRDRSDVLSVSIVGYTNAGKSTLFNRLTKANVYVANQLFATLDTTSRRMYAEGEGEIVVSDTVGFIRHLPHGLVAAFRSTLEETIQADVLLHVVDASNPNHDDQIAEVNKVLGEIDAGDIPQILVYNKIDVSGEAAGVQRDECDRISRVFLSAKSGAGMDDLRQTLLEIRAARQAATVIEKQLKQARESWD
jgi:GTP-binding protein HflX